jgi:hypothetical protein
MSPTPVASRLAVAERVALPEPAVAVAVGEAAHIGSLVDLVGSRRVLSNRLMIKQGRDF